MLERCCPKNSGRSYNSVTQAQHQPVHPGPPTPQGITSGGNPRPPARPATAAEVSHAGSRRARPRPWLGPAGWAATAGTSAPAPGPPHFLRRTSAGAPSPAARPSALAPHFLSCTSAGISCPACQGYLMGAWHRLARLTQESQAGLKPCQRTCTPPHHGAARLRAGRGAVQPLAHGSPRPHPQPTCSPGRVRLPSWSPALTLKTYTTTPPL